MARFRWNLSEDVPLDGLERLQVAAQIAHVVAQCDIDVEITLDVSPIYGFRSKIDRVIRDVNDIRRCNHLCHVIIELINTAAGVKDEKAYLM